MPYLQEPKPMLYDIDAERDPHARGRRDQDDLRDELQRNVLLRAHSNCPSRKLGLRDDTGRSAGLRHHFGPETHQRGSLLELSWGGKEPFDIGGGQTRSFIEDGDTLTLHGAARGDGYRIGFGTCTGTVRPAVKFP